MPPRNRIRQCVLFGSLLVFLFAFPGGPLRAGNAGTDAQAHQQPLQVAQVARNEGRTEQAVNLLSPTLRIGLHADHTFFPSVDGKSSDRLAIGVYGYWSHSLGDRPWLNLSAMAEHREYLEDDVFSGPYATVGVQWGKRLASGDTLSLWGALERSRPSLGYHRDGGQSCGRNPSATLSKTFRAGVSLGTTLRVHDDDFIATNPPRRDNVYRIGLSVSDSRIRLFDTTPRLSCEYEMQQSNIALHEMNPTVCRISREFRF